MFLLDCGRRMRADDTQHGIGATHFDQSLDRADAAGFRRA